MNNLTLIFPSFEHSRREPDVIFHREISTLESLGIDIRVFDMTRFTEGEIEEAFRYFGEDGDGTILYRGFIHKVDEYQTFDIELKKRGFRLFNQPNQYRTATLLPEYFSYIEKQAIPAVWTSDISTKAVLKTAEQLGSPPWFVKDYTKSAKELGMDNCIIGDTSNLNRETNRVIQNLIEYRGRWFEGGIVVRPYIPLHYIEQSPFGDPTFEEYRLFFFRGKLISISANGWFDGLPNDTTEFEKIASQIPSNFFSMDIVKTAAGEWMILELGDGGSSELTRNADPLEFYTAIQRRV